MEFFRRYLRQHRLAILLFILSWGLLAASFALYGLPLAAVAYPALLSLLLCLAAAVWDYTRTLRRHRKLSELQTAANAQLMDLPEPASIGEGDCMAAIAALRRSGCEVVLLTGDNQHTAEAIARQVGVDRVIAQVLPQDKARCIEDLQKAGRLVAMVGDGVNDAPALVTADVGLAIGAGTDVAIESADVVLMRSSLMDIVDAAALSRATLRNIRQNLFWAFFYNSIGIPVAAGVLYPALGITLNPMIAAAAMSLSSVCVVSNALRLRGWKGSAPVRRGEAPANTQSEPAAPATQHNEEEPTMKKTLSIEGMMCAHCAAHVEKALNALPGVTHNYLRNHDFNVWFTLIGPSWDSVCDTIKGIEERTGISIMNLPAEKLFKIRVDFQMEE